MKKIAVIIPVNNPEMINQDDFKAYQSSECHFEVMYIDTPLKELTSAVDAAKVIPLTLEKAIQAEKDGFDGIVVFAFGDVAVKEARACVSIPVIGLGKAATHMASLLCQRAYTVLPAGLSHYAFIEELVFDEGLQRKFIKATTSVELSPMQLRTTPTLIEDLVKSASFEFKDKGIDTFTLGCGCFIGVAKKLQVALRETLQAPVTVVDPVDVPFKLIQALI